MIYSQIYLNFIPDRESGSISLFFCQTLGLVLRLRVDFVLPLSQEQEEEQEEPLTKIYQWGMH